MAVPHHSQIIRSKDENIIIEKPNLKIACILDNFSYQCFKFECDLIQLEPHNYMDIMLDERPAILLVESACYGANNSWLNKICNIKDKSALPLENLIELCNKLKIPTVFWNKEDPCHFNDFFEAAKLFDYIFTTDENCIPKYKEFLHHDRVYVLPFAAQKKIHNPIEKDRKKTHKIAFAGSWYDHMHLDRKKNMEFMLKPALKYDLHIYDRNYNHNYIYYDPYKFPEIYQSFIKGYVPYEKITDIYKKYDIFLNVNSVDDSPTMFSRRVFELLACGTIVISSYSLGIEKMFPGIVALSKTKEDTLMNLDILLKNKDLRDRLSLLGIREIFNKHTYTDRIETILDETSIPYNKSTDPGVSIITCTNREDTINHIFENYDRQLYQNKELVIILNNANINSKIMKNKSEKYKNIKIIQMSETKTLGKCLNYAINNSSLEYVAIFSDNCYYGPNYLVDSMNAFKYTNAAVVGKYSYFAYMERTKQLSVISPNTENQYIDFVAYSTMIIKRNVFSSVTFSEEVEKEYSTFLKNCAKKNFLIYAVDRFNFVCINHLSSNENLLNIKDEDTLNKFKLIRNTDDYVSYVTV